MAVRCHKSSVRTPLKIVLAAAAAATGAVAVSSADCWVGGWTPEICCSAPGALGNPLCWDHTYTFDKCCTETEEGIQFDLRRRNFISDMVRRGATVQFDIRHVSGGRTGAVASRTLAPRSTVLRVPASQVYSLKSVPAPVSEAAGRRSCDAHAVLALGLALERVNPASMLTDWIRLLPMSFANVLWFTEKQLLLVNSTFFSYVVGNWFGDLQCMQRAADEIPPSAWRGRRVDFEDLRWALSVVKTRGFAFEGTRESTMLIPLADFLNHNRVASVRTATVAEDALRFVATTNVNPGDELCIDYAQASNLEFLVRYGFHVDGNPYGGRQFDLGGEPLQAHCPSYILRYDIPDVVDNATVDCHRQARYLSFEQQFGMLQPHEQLREDRYIYHAVEQACQQLLLMLDEPPPSLPEEDMQGAAAKTRSASDAITTALVGAIRKERVLLQQCIVEFQRRQTEMLPRPLPATLAEPLARLRGPGPAGEAPGGAAPTMEATPPQRAASPPAGAYGASGFTGGAGGYAGGVGPTAGVNPGGTFAMDAGGYPAGGYSASAHGQSGATSKAPYANVGGYAAAGGQGGGLQGGFGGGSFPGYGAQAGAQAAPYAGAGTGFGMDRGWDGAGYEGARDAGQIAGAGANGFDGHSSYSGYGGDGGQGGRSAAGALGGLGQGSPGLGGVPPGAGLQNGPYPGGDPAAAPVGSFASSTERSRVDQLLQRLQLGVPIA